VKTKQNKENKSKELLSYVLTGNCRLSARKRELQTSGQDDGFLGKIQSR
jgi:hypothetical protein